MLTENDVFDTLEHMPDDMKLLFYTMPSDYQVAYATFWASRPDKHAAHRDTLPAFISGLFAGLHR